MLARHIGNVQVEIGLEHWPNIYCGTAVLMLFLLYLVCRNISLREKAVYCSLLLFFAGQLFSQCAELYMARLPLSKQSAGQTVLYLHRFDADGLLSGLQEPGSVFPTEAFWQPFWGPSLLCSCPRNSGRETRPTISPYFTARFSSLPCMQG